MKKEERVQIIKELSENTFDSQGLFLSSKSLGQNKLTMKEKLRLSLLEHKAGLVPSQPDNRLFVTKEVDEDDMATMTPKPSQKYVSKKEQKKLSKDGEIAAELEMMDVDAVEVKTIQVVTSDGTKTTNSTEEVVVKPTVNASGFSFNNNNTAFGGALKSKIENDTTQATISKRKKKHQKEESSNSDSEADQQVKLITEKKRKTNWSLNVVDGEKIENNVPEEIIKLTRIFKQKEDELHALSSKDNAPIVPVTGIKANPAYYVTINRPEHINKLRDSLPVVAEEQPIMEAIYANPIVILCGETGSGSTLIFTFINKN